MPLLREWDTAHARPHSLRLPGIHCECLKTGLPGPRIIHLELPNPRSNMTLPFHHIVVCRPKASGELVFKCLILVHLYGQSQNTRQLLGQEQHDQVAKKLTQVSLCAILTFPPYIMCMTGCSHVINRSTPLHLPLSS